ncbi:hypothetical protein AC1031_002333 [Aphanomyces cochlioides]|nr:hypothetical protein AC1031_002333 [Aphanomyces cochlioides]
MAVDWKRRILTFVVAAPVAIYLLRSTLGSSALATVILAGCLTEYRLNLCPQVLFHTAGRKPQAKNHAWHAAFLVIVGCLVGASATQGKAIHDGATAAVYLTVFGYHLSLASFPLASSLHAGLIDLLLDLFALGYIVNGFSHAILVRQATSFGMGLQIMTLSASWICDTGALVMGSLVGKTKLLPTVSPGKTTAGACGSVLFGVFTVVGAQFIANSALPAMSLAEQVVLGASLGVLCVMGDLVESYMKRVAQVKDSGTLFPGHGGCLDRMDSLLFIAPLMYYWGQWNQWQ